MKRVRFEQEESNEAFAGPIKALGVVLGHGRRKRARGIRIVPAGQGGPFAWAFQETPSMMETMGGGAIVPHHAFTPDTTGGGEAVDEDEPQQPDPTDTNWGPTVKPPKTEFASVDDKEHKLAQDEKDKEYAAMEEEALINELGKKDTRTPMQKGLDDVEDAHAAEELRDAKAEEDRLQKEEEAAQEADAKLAAEHEAWLKSDEGVYVTMIGVIGPPPPPPALEESKNDAWTDTYRPAERHRIELANNIKLEQWAGEIAKWNVKVQAYNREHGTHIEPIDTGDRRGLLARTLGWYYGAEDLNSEGYHHDYQAQNDAELTSNPFKAQFWHQLGDGDLWRQYGDKLASGDPMALVTLGGMILDAVTVAIPVARGVLAGGRALGTIAGAGLTAARVAAQQGLGRAAATAMIKNAIISEARVVARQTATGAAAAARNAATRVAAAGRQIAELPGRVGQGAVAAAREVAALRRITAQQAIANANREARAASLTGTGRSTAMNQGSVAGVRQLPRPGVFYTRSQLLDNARQDARGFTDLLGEFTREAHGVPHGGYTPAKVRNTSRTPTKSEQAMRPHRAGQPTQPRAPHGPEHIPRVSKVHHITVREAARQAAAKARNTIASRLERTFPSPAKTRHTTPTTRRVVEIPPAERHTELELGTPAQPTRPRAPSTENPAIGTATYTPRRQGRDSIVRVDGRQQPLDRYMVNRQTGAVEDRPEWIENLGRSAEEIAATQARREALTAEHVRTLAAARAEGNLLRARNAEAARVEQSIARREALMNPANARALEDAEILRVGRAHVKDQRIIEEARLAAAERARVADAANPRLAALRGGSLKATDHLHAEESVFHQLGALSNYRPHVVTTATPSGRAAIQGLATNTVQREGIRARAIHDAIDARRAALRNDFPITRQDFLTPQRVEARPRSRSRSRSSGNSWHTSSSLAESTPDFI